MSPELAATVKANTLSFQIKAWAVQMIPSGDNAAPLPYPNKHREVIHDRDVELGKITVAASQCRGGLQEATVNSRGQRGKSQERFRKNSFFLVKVCIVGHKVVHSCCFLQIKSQKKVWTVF